MAQKVNQPTYRRTTFFKLRAGDVMRGWAGDVMVVGVGYMGNGAKFVDIKYPTNAPAHANEEARLVSHVDFTDIQIRVPKGDEANGNKENGK